MTTRTFLALDLDDAIRGRLLAAVGDLAAAGAKVRWVARENLHVTVKFLGEVDEGNLAEVCRAVAGVAEGLGPFDFTVRGVRCVPSGGKVRMVWAEVAEPTGRLASMFERLEAALEPLSFAPERREFRPHVTLGRVSAAPNPRDLRGAAARHAQADFGTTRAREIVVYGSELTPRGPIYTPLARGTFGRP